MSLEIFSGFKSAPAVKPGFVKQKNNSVNDNSCAGDKQSDITKSSNFKSVMPYVLPMAAIPVTALITHKLSSKNVQALQSEIKNLSKNLADIKELQNQAIEGVKKSVTENNAQNIKNNALVWSAIAGIAGLGAGAGIDKITDDEKQKIVDTASTRLTDINKKASEAKDIAQTTSALSSNVLNSKYTKNVNGILLLNNPVSADKNSKKYDKAIDKIQKSASKYLFETPSIKPINSQTPVIWSVTSEFAPIKEGGLGCVPVEIQANAEKLGVKMPTFIPMYQQGGIASFRQQGDKYFYTYKNKEFELKKAASFKIDSWKDGKSQLNDVEIFVSTTKDKQGNDKQLVFVKNDDYFNGAIYQTNEKSEEPEKFAFFSKAVYEFAKAKEDINSVKALKIEDQDTFDSIKSPDGFILNDWQASPVAALLRYKAPLENAYSRLSQDAASKLSDINVITIGHNAMYQGSTANDNNDKQRYQVTSNILNTLFDNYAYDIVSNAKSGASKTDPEDPGLKNLDNVLILNEQDSTQNHTNLLNMGITLSNCFHPVSQNYADELVSPKHSDLSYELQWALTQKAKAGSLIGIINGNDFNNLSIEAKQGQIKQQTGLDFETYNKKSSPEFVEQARLANKIKFYNEFMIPFSNKEDEAAVNSDPKVADVAARTTKLEYVKGNNDRELPKLSEEELAKTPVIASVGRFVSQKGIDVLSDSIKLLFDNWEKDFPDKPKPIFYIAGSDGENGKQRKYIEDLKNNKLNAEDSQRVILAHGFAPMAGITASSDFFLLPSKFEPCGLTQGESFALATPVIGSAVGGIVDTVNRGDKTDGILTDKDEKLSPESFCNAMKKGLDIYFNNPEQYKKMVNDSLAEDFSWIQKGKKGPVYDYLNQLGIDINKLNDVL